MQRPSFQFYPGDWLSDTALRVCSSAARGLWIDMLCLMHFGNPYGHLTLPNGIKIDMKMLKKMINFGMENDKNLTRKLSKLIQELVQNGVIKYTENGTIYSKRMIDDELKRQAWQSRQNKCRDKKRENCHASVTQMSHQQTISLSRLSSSSSSSSSSILKEKRIYKKKENEDDAQKVLDYLNRKKGSKYTKTDEILARLKEGHTVDECIYIINTKALDPHFIKNPKHINPVTLFRKNHFDIYLNERPEDFNESNQSKPRYSAERFKKIAIEKGLYKEEDNGKQ